MTTPIDRMVPHSVEAEEAVLGSLLIDPETIFRVSPFLRADDFYIVKNRWVYEACLALHERREPIDFVTVTEALEKREQLAEIGGPAFVSHLINVVPTAIHAEGYGRIVERAAVRRKLLQAASDIAQYAYDEAADVDETIDQSEQALFAVSQRRQSRELQPIGDVVRSYYERIEYLYEHRGEPLGIPTGFIDLDKLLGGLQRSDLVVVASRPGIGKSSLLLSVALSAARKFHQRVAIFTLEMSSEQLVQRMISAETGIDSQRLRLGELRDDEWPLFVQASSALSDALIHLDDTPSISVLQLRTKARRLHAEHGLDLIVVDYLQLMSGDTRAENRVQEISYISRALKGLARELSVPVLAASQLSRSVEQRGDKRPILSDLRESGCLAGDTLVTLADSGARVPIRSLVSQSGFRVWALNEQTLKIEAAQVSRAFSTGRKPVYRLETRLGRVIRATGNHKFRTLRDWQRLDTLKVGDRIALPRKVQNHVLIMGHDDILAFAETVGAVGAYRSKALAECRTCVDKHPANTNRDVIPNDIWRRYAVPAMQRRGMSTRQMQHALGIAYMGTGLYRQNISRARAERLVLAVGEDEYISALATSDVYWDQIMSIVPDGEEDVYDLTVPGPNNFVANDIAVHNSIEQDADVVMFIYRDDVYDLQSERKNVAEIIIAKHRNGPTGTIELYFRSQLAQFVNATRREITL